MCQLETGRLPSARAMVGAALIALGFSPEARAAPNGDPASAIHDHVLVLDSHADVLLPSTSASYRAPEGGSRVDLAHLVAGGVDAVLLAVAVGPGPRDAAGVAAARGEADAKLAAIKAFVAANPKQVGLALSAGDVERLHSEHRIAVLISFLNARSIGSDVSQLGVFYNEGVRVFGLAHAGHNDFTDSSRPAGGPVSEHGGLSPLGREAVQRLNDLGALIDVSQLSTDALFQTLKLSRAPVAATHSDARALVDNSRNLSDAELDAIKANGGVVQVTPFNSYLQRLDSAARERVRVVRVRFGLPGEFVGATEGHGSLSKDEEKNFLSAVAAVQPSATIGDLVDHIDYIARRIGWEHVGVGSDFNHGAGVTGFDSEADALNVTRELVRRGYTEKQIAAIWGGNFLRVLRAAEAARAR